MSTISGLDRFRDFAVATLSVKQGLSNAMVGSVLADRDGSIVWLGTYGGLNRWNNEQITSYAKGNAQAHRHANTMSGSDKREGKFDGQVPQSLFQDNRGRIWVSTLDGFGYLENGRSIPLRGVPGGTVLSITQDRAGHLWVANEHLGLLHLNSSREVEQIPWVWPR